MYNYPRRILSSNNKYTAEQAEKSQPSKEQSQKMSGFNPEYDYLFKFQLIGDSGCGKSCLLIRFADDTYTDSYVSTIGVDFKMKSLPIGDKMIKTQVWDTAGQERFRTIQSNYYRGAHGAIVVFDLTDQVSFNNIKDWIKLYREKENNNGNIILIGNKADLVTKRVVDQTTIDDFINDPTNQVDAYIETSAKTGENVNAAFQVAAEAVMKRVAPEAHSKIVKHNQSMQANNQSLQETRNKLISDLEKYIKKIESHTSPYRPGKPDFSHGFLFFSSSRAINREANYHLAKLLCNDLKTTGKTIAEIFSDVIGRRNLIIGENDFDKRPDFVERGINDNDLNDIINAARNNIPTTPSETKPLLRKS